MGSFLRDMSSYNSSYFDARIEKENTLCGIKKTKSKKQAEVTVAIV